jgi:hypothetical protein
VGPGFFPLDEELQLLPGGLSPWLYEGLARLGTWMPFGRAAELLAAFTGVTVSEDVARQRTEAAGAAQVALQTAEVEQLERAAPPVPPGPDKQYLSADGAFIPLVGGTWAEVKSVVIGEVAEPVVEKGLKFFRSRLVNTLVGCAVGLLFVSIGEPTPWRLPFALAITVLLSSYFVRMQVMWRQAPITAAIVIAGTLSAYSKTVGMEVGLLRVAEVIFGSVVALGVSWLMSKIWSVREPKAKPDGAVDKT